MKKYLVLTLALTLVLAFSCSHESINESKSVLEIEQESTLKFDEKLISGSQSQKQSETSKDPMTTGLQVDIGPGGGGNGGCAQSNYGVSGDCNSGYFNGLVSAECVPFTVYGQYSGGSINNLQISINHNDYTVTSTSFYYVSSQSKFYITVNYTERELTQNQTTQNLEYIYFYRSRTLHFTPCNSQIL